MRLEKSHGLKNSPWEEQGHVLAQILLGERKWCYSFCLVGLCCFLVD